MAVAATDLTPIHTIGILPVLCQPRDDCAGALSVFMHAFTKQELSPSSNIRLAVTYHW